MLQPTSECICATNYSKDSGWAKHGMLQPQSNVCVESLWRDKELIQPVSSYGVEAETVSDAMSIFKNDPGSAKHGMPLPESTSLQVPAGSVRDENSVTSMILERAQSTSNLSAPAIPRCLGYAKINIARPSSCFIAGFVNGHRVKDMLIDTGSVITVCNERLWATIRPRSIYSLGPGAQVNAANGS